MTEGDAKAWIAARYDADAIARLERFAAMVVQENERQNLISPATCAQIWVRHIVDSAQLLPLAASDARNWLDIGSGAGFPGMVIAALWPGSVALVEPRARRADFLRAVAAALGLTNVIVHHSRVEAVTGQFDILSARAVAAVPALLDMTRHLRGPKTRMILPRGRNGATEMEQLPRTWRGMFHVEHSVTDPASVIIVADGVTG
ncbi:MAG: 16S rRNA (guanine(527)-N(7))-methyltransferase RsmG [Sphingomonas taxi]|uniref:Ribosomal RNA small subunit methyltransferase G n=1 Tax=Sphingomonas taxi TaxID=1549858 RepID=A0A2W5QVC5_9SPHN|nr:MAG: 16S rRNA (guanine(527)-N(7))-methyltransferase RsmG [Sphingomonas taxi]